jgi:hypothetical protein
MLAIEDNLKGISEAIEAVFPRAEVQKCVVHQIRNSLRYVSWKERKPMAKDLRRIYEAAKEKQGAAALVSVIGIPLLHLEENGFPWMWLWIGTVSVVTGAFRLRSFLRGHPRNQEREA